jgi:hypothetical protein
MSASSSAQTDLRHFDFKNFSYPMTGPKLGHDRLMWLDSSVPGRIRLVNGNGRLRSEGFSLRSLEFADVTGDGREDAIVVIHYDTGGTQQTDYIYIYAPSSSGPKLLAYCYTGDRAYSGLHEVFGEQGYLVIELLDPDKQKGDCCSDGLVLTRYKWLNGRFEQIGKPVHEAFPLTKDHPHS